MSGKLLRRIEKLEEELERERAGDVAWTFRFVDDEGRTWLEDRPGEEGAADEPHLALRPSLRDENELGR
jgi:hypothetical protein